MNCHIMSTQHPYEGEGSLLLTECGRSIPMSSRRLANATDTWCIAAFIHTYARDRAHKVCVDCLDSDDYALFLLGRVG
jgi:hypothetical protein